MFQKINFFSNQIRKFKKKKALILENGQIITYENLLKKKFSFSSLLEKEKNLVFLLGQNNLETITGYISFVDKGYAVVLIDYRVNEIFLEKLINIYKPAYVYCEQKKFKIDKIYQRKFYFKSYICLKRKRKINIKFDKNLMLLISTSGSTGSPKFVRQSYLNINSNTKSIIKYLKISSKDVAITSLPFTYVYGLSVINTHLIAGATIVLSNKSITEKKYWDLIKSYEVNNFAGVPYSYSIIERFFKKDVPKSISYTTQAGGKMNNHLIRALLKIYNKNKIKFFQMYGSAEATARMSYLNPKFAEKKVGSIGKPISGGKFYIIDKYGKKKNNNNFKGELVYRGKNVCMGYAEKLNDLSLPNLNKGILKTGDIAYKDKEGFYFIVGRKNRYVKVFGLRVNLSELENILSKKGIDTIMKEGNENKIEIFFRSLTRAKENISFLSRMTGINQNTFIIKKITKKNFTKNYKFKI